MLIPDLGAEEFLQNDFSRRQQQYKVVKINEK